jgi:putative ABC transport system substrate-binding protein
VTDPIAFGFVESFARPGGNLTGFSRGIERLTVKRLELLQQMLPKATRATFLYIDDNPHHVKQAEELRMAAEGRRLSISYLGLPSREWSVPRLEEILPACARTGWTPSSSQTPMSRGKSSSSWLPSIG